MTDIPPEETMSRGVISYATEDGMVAHGVVIVDPLTGNPVHALAGITLTPEIARRVAMNLTLASIKAEEAGKK